MVSKRSILTSKTLPECPPVNSAYKHKKQPKVTLVLKNTQKIVIFSICLHKERFRIERNI